MTKKKIYTVIYEPGDESGTWTAHVAEVAGAIIQARSIAQARTRVREALALVLDVAGDRFDLEEVVKLPPKLQRQVDAYRKQRDEAEAEAKKAGELSRAAVRAVLDAGYSTRDAGEALGLSQTRVAQLAGE